MSSIHRSLLAGLLFALLAALLHSPSADASCAPVRFDLGGAGPTVEVLEGGMTTAPCTRVAP